MMWWQVISAGWARKTLSVVSMRAFGGGHLGREEGGGKGESEVLTAL